MNYRKQVTTTEQVKSPIGRHASETTQMVLDTQDSQFQLVCVSITWKGYCEDFIGVSRDTKSCGRTVRENCLQRVSLKE
jgi:hypothetical protein